MEEFDTPGKLMNSQMGHDDGSVQARYSHITATKHRRLTDDLTRTWQEAIDIRRALSPPVAALDKLLTGTAGAPDKQDRLPEFSRTTPTDETGPAPREGNRS